MPMLVIEVSQQKTSYNLSVGLCCSITVGEVWGYQDVGNMDGISPTLFLY